MAVLTYTDECTSPIPPARAFKAWILDADNLIPKLMPEAFKSVEVLQGDGSAGTIKQINFAEGGPFKCVKHRVDEISKTEYKYCYTLVEGDVLVGKFEKICYEIQLVASPDGGTISKTIVRYYPLAGAVINEEEIKAGMEKAGGMFKVVDDYLVQNPTAYA
ncbi:major allergen Pru ar 1-like [Diospyros lotus]|uniref:major allergen Pru ar 1-like n=1 Tax=Diospyros lotus TaxID=55363 RepID=UPI00225593DA|nr:major allergen Pru ar 1-like [Diospyros lotus]